MTQINTLPSEVLAHLFKFVPTRDLASAAATCRLFQYVLESEAVWRDKSRQDYSVFISPGGKFSARDIYTKILHKYGKLLGLWQSVDVPYGGLYSVTFNEDKIFCHEYKAPKGSNVRNPLRKILIFTVNIDEEGYASPTCHKGYTDPHGCIAYLERSGKLYYRCSWREYHEHPDGPTAAFIEWMEENTGADGNPLANQINLIHFMTDQRMDQHIDARPFTIPPSPRDCILQPGLFKGTYSAHGIEIVLLEYSEDCSKLTLTKITGDPNIPATKVTVEVDLKRPMILSAEQQQSMELLSEIDIPDAPPESEISKMPAQPFFVPREAYDRSSDAQAHPKSCKARFHSKGQIAGHNYNNPSFTNGHFVVFDENTFGHLWIELSSFSLFSRVTENLSNNVKH